MNKLPVLPEGYSWDVEIHRNIVVGDVCDLRIVRRVSKSFLGLSYTGKRVVAHSVTYPEWVDGEAVAMVKALTTA